jgi:hypothetical protein
MLTDTQIDFVLQIECLFDETDEGRLGDDYLAQIFRATAANDDLEVARLCAMMLLALMQRRRVLLVPLAQKWCELFDSMFAQASPC